MARVIFVLGEAPSPASQPGEQALSRSWPKLAGIAGMDPDELDQLCHRANVVPEWRGHQGKGSSFDPTPDEVSLALARLGSVEWGILLGKRVAKALGIKDPKNLSEYDLDGTRVLVLPHPSRVNRYWNDPKRTRVAQDALRRFIKRAALRSVERHA